MLICGLRNVYKEVIQNVKKSYQIAIYLIISFLFVLPSFLLYIHVFICNIEKLEVI